MLLKKAVAKKTISIKSASSRVTTLHSSTQNVSEEIKLRQRILRVLSSMKERKILASASKTVLQVNLTFLEFLTQSKPFLSDKFCYDHLSRGALTINLRSIWSLESLFTQDGVTKPIATNLKGFSQRFVSHWLPKICRPFN